MNEMIKKKTGGIFFVLYVIFGSLVYTGKIYLPKTVSFKHATQIPACEVLPIKAINMHVFFLLPWD